MKKKCTVICAKGEKTFSDDQLRRLRSNFKINFIANLTPLTDSEFIRIAGNTEILALTRRAISDLNSDILSKLTDLTGIAAYSTGYEWIDVNYCRERKIRVRYLKNYSTDTVAEHTLAMLLSLSRRIHLSHDKCRSLVSENVSLRGFEVNEKSVGIIGFGRIGKRFCRIIRTLTKNISYYDPKKTFFPQARFKSKNSLIETSDVIVILANKKRGETPIIGFSEVEKMKDGVVLVNSSRKTLVDTDAVIHGIRQKKIYGYAVDDKIDDFNSVDLEPGRILQTHHTAWYSDESISRGTEEWVKNIIAFR